MAAAMTSGFDDTSERKATLVNAPVNYLLGTTDPMRPLPVQFFLAQREFLAQVLECVEGTEKEGWSIVTLVS